MTFEDWIIGKKIIVPKQNNDEDEIISYKDGDFSDPIVHTKKGRMFILNRTNSDIQTLEKTGKLLNSFEFTQEEMEKEFKHNNNKALSIVGSSRNNGDREKDDFYPTPAYAVEELLKREEFIGTIWEPACGEGDITKVLLKQEKYGDIFSSDLINRGYGQQIDFLNNDKDFMFDNIITNPPFKLSLDFVLQSKKHARNKIAMFLKTVWLESADRYHMFQDKDFQLKTMYQFSKRVSLTKNGIKMKNSGMISFAWFVWDKNYSGKPNIEWII